MTEELQPSKLGTKEYWDDIYEQELANFEGTGDEGEVWFGEETVEKIVGWITESVPSSTKPYTLEIGSGNGDLLFALSKAGYATDRLLGIDCSPGAVKLAQAIAVSRGPGITFSTADFLHDNPPRLPGQTPSDESIWDLLLDKGTFDAIALSIKDHNGKSLAVQYPGRVSGLLKPGGYFLITSCNFTEDELKNYFVSADSGLMYHSRIQHRTYEYGGNTGTICSSVVFLKEVRPTES